MAFEADQTPIQCICGKLSAQGSYRVEGRWLIVDSTLGEIRANLGLLDPDRAARRMLRNVCTAAEKAAALRPTPQKVRSET